MPNTQLPLERYLEDLESRIVPAHEDALFSQWRLFASRQFQGQLFAPARPAPNPPHLPWPHVRVNAALDHPDLMALQQFETCSHALANASGHLMMVRANFGTPILPAVFGAKLFIMPDNTDTLPACHPLDGGSDAIQRLLDRGIPDIANHPHAQKVFAMGQRFMTLKSKYPKINQYVHLYHPDLQGPMDVCELLWGSAIFTELFDVPDLVHAALKLITDTYIQYLRLWAAISPFRLDGFCPHWGFLHQGHIMLRNDSAMNLSPDMFRQFILPYDQRLLTEFHGGAIHSCGRVDHFAPILPEYSLLHAFNVSQPHLNNMETIYQNTIDRNIPLIGLAPETAQSALTAHRPLHGKVHC